MYRRLTIVTTNQSPPLSTVWFGFSFCSVTSFPHCSNNQMYIQLNPMWCPTVAVRSLSVQLYGSRNVLVFYSRDPCSVVWWCRRSPSPLPPLRITYFHHMPVARTLWGMIAGPRGNRMCLSPYSPALRPRRFSFCRLLPLHIHVYGSKVRAYATCG